MIDIYINQRIVPTFEGEKTVTTKNNKFYYLYNSCWCKQRRTLYIKTEELYTTTKGSGTMNSKPKRDHFLVFDSIGVNDDHHYQWPHY